MTLCDLSVRLKESFLAAVGAVCDVSGGSAAGVLQGQLGMALPSDQAMAATVLTATSRCKQDPQDAHRMLKMQTESLRCKHVICWVLAASGTANRQLHLSCRQNCTNLMLGN